MNTVSPSTGSEGPGLSLAAALRSTLAELASEAHPEECCGFLVGTAHDGVHRVHRLLPAPNTYPSDRKRGYLIAAEEYLAAEQSARVEDHQVLGFYHSHPDGVPRPSRKDLEEALPGCSYLIVATAADGSTVMESWRLAPDGTGFQRERLGDSEGGESR